MMETPVVHHPSVEVVAISTLKVHPKNAEIYGKEDVTALKQSIAESGWIKPLTVTPDHVIISGHRRYQAALELGYTEIPVVVEAFPSEEAEMERLLRENENRGKMPEQQIREGMTWEDVEGLKDKTHGGDRRSSNFQDKNFYLEKGRPADIIARRVGLGSGVTYEKGKEVVLYMDDMLRCGSERRSILRMNLNDDSINAAYKAMKRYIQFDEEAEKKREREEAERARLQELARQRYLEAVKKAEHCTLYHCSVANLHERVQSDSIDAIITDPPYPQEFLPVYADLAKFAAYALKQGGIMAVMVGQSYLEQVLQLLNSADGVEYRWACAYFTPGPAPQLHHREIQSMWKPVLLYSKGEITKGRYIIDVFRSELKSVRTAEEEKRHHEWGQSEAGIADIMQRVTDENDLVCDPFVGGGSCARVAIEIKRRFIGCDVDEACVRSLEEMKASMIERQKCEV